MARPPAFRVRWAPDPARGQTGIRKLREYDAALTILTTYRLRPEDRPYEDNIGADNYPRYKWRGTDAEHADNLALRRAMELGKPLAWLEGVETGVYLVHVPVWLVGEEAEQHQFVLALDQTMREQWRPEALLSAPDLALRAQYALAVVRRRLHQPMFRRRVLAAYRTSALSAGSGTASSWTRRTSGKTPRVASQSSRMGSPCACSHKAFDALVVGVRPDFVIEVRRDVLDEQDGPTLQHALQGVHGSELLLPQRRSARPRADLLEERYERFRKAS